MMSSGLRRTTRRIWCAWAATPADESDDATRTILRLHCGQRHPARAYEGLRHVRILHELIAAPDRRVPQINDASEASIAREAAALKERLSCPAR